jgi:hypothetical protein
MRKNRWFATMLALVLLGGACSGENGVTNTTRVPNQALRPSLGGTWLATRYDLSMAADSSVRWNWLASGTSVRLELKPTRLESNREVGVVTLIVSVPGNKEIVLTGDWVAPLTSGTIMIEFGAPEWWWMVFAVTSDGKQIDLLEDASYNLEGSVFPMTFDFDNCGSEEVGRLGMRFVHQ